MERLRDCEHGLRAAGRWEKADLLEYTRERLEQIDAFIYPQDAFADLVEVEELGRTALADDSVALACRAHVGIYEVERQLARFHGPRLGLLVLRQREGVYTLRQTDPAQLAYVLLVWLAGWALGYSLARRRQEQDQARRALQQQVIAEERIRCPASCMTWSGTPSTCSWSRPARLG